MTLEAIIKELTTKKEKNNFYKAINRVMNILIAQTTTTNKNKKNHEFS